MSYIYWALLGMVGYSFVMLFVKLATRDQLFSSFFVLAIATSIVMLSATTISMLRGDFAGKSAEDFVSASALWSYATGIALTVAVCSLFCALSSGQVSVVVPIYGMFIIGATLLGVFFLGEPMHFRKYLGIAFAVASIILIVE